MNLGPVTVQCRALLIGAPDALAGMTGGELAIVAATARTQRAKETMT